MPLKKSRLVNFRMDDELFDNVEKFAEEKNITSSEAYRILTKSGLRLEGIKPEEITKEKVDEMIQDGVWFLILDGQTRLNTSIKRFFESEIK